MNWIKTKYKLPPHLKGKLEKYKTQTIYDWIHRYDKMSDESKKKNRSLLKKLPYRYRAAFWDAYMFYKFLSVPIPNLIKKIGEMASILPKQGTQILRMRKYDL